MVGAASFRFMLSKENLAAQQDLSSLRMKQSYYLMYEEK